MEDSATITESSLISKLQSSSDLSSIHHLVSLYLHPFSDIINKPDKHSKSSKPNAETSTTIRSLAKKFISFLNKALSFIPKRLNETPKIDSSYASELFEAYKLCLSCLESVLSAISCKPYHIQMQRVRLIHCYENWGRYDDAQKEGFLVLEFIGKLLDTRSGNVKGRVIPELGKENCDKDVAVLILEVAVTLVKCVSNGRSKDEEDYHRLLSMVDEIQPWFRVVDVDVYEKLHKMLVAYLNKCTLFLVGELASFDGGLVHIFCVLTFSEFTKPSMNGQMEKFGHRICSSVFSQLGDNFLCSVDILTCVLDAMAHECKNGKEKSLVDFLELADYCAHKCRNATVDFCCAVATHFNKIAREFSQVDLSAVDYIMRLYAITLSMSDLIFYSNRVNTKIPEAGKVISILKLLLNVEDQLQSLNTRNGLLTQMTYVPLYFTALKFFCGPVSELIISERKDVLSGLEDVSFSLKLPNIQDVFHQFGLVFLTYRESERERNVYEDNRRTVNAVAAAAFTLSFATKENVKESTTFLKHIISADWVRADGLQYHFATLNNVGIVLYRINRLEEATSSFKLSCQAAWNCILHFCKILTSGRDESSSDLSEDTIAGFATEACAKSAFLLDVLNQCGSNKISKIFTDSLDSWSVGQSLFDQIPTPVALIKQWVKIQCKQIKDPEAGHTIPTIYSLMSSSSKISKETFGILLEQELQAYKEMKSLNPTLCKTMQITITKVLLEEIYSTKDSSLQKSRILISKGRESRAYGFEGLDDCLKYLSEAISILSDYNSKDNSGPVCHLLAEAYCLHALCTQEAEPNSKHFIQDVGNALKLWLGQEHFQSSEQAQNTLILLYHVADFVSLKGYMEEHSSIYEIMIRIFTWKNMPLQEYLTLLWQSRSLSHALCASPVNDAFLMTLSNHCNLSTSMEFWISCLKGSKSLEVGFQQSLSLISTLSSPNSSKHNHATDSHIRIDEVKQAASDLINSAPMSSKSLFLAANLYYDLGERMIAQGLMIEALYYANEANRLRTKLLQRNFIYSIEQQSDMVGANGDTSQKRKYVVKTFHMHPSKAWSYDKGSGDLEACFLTPWNILKVYLESTLQIGTLQEIVGNGYEAESHLLWGKNIASFHDLLIFIVGFSCALGKLYCKQQLWHLAESELESAKRMLTDRCSHISCLKCNLVLEVTIDQQLGDLFRRRFNSTSGNKLLEGLSRAEIFYMSATGKLKVSEWKNCISDCEEGSARSTMFCDAFPIGENQGEQDDDFQMSGQETVRPKATRKSKRIAKPVPEKKTTSRITRSSKQRGEVTCVSDEVNCWHCLPSETMKSNSLTSIIQMKWECTRRRLLLRLLTGIGKCLGVRGEIQKAREVLFESISMLVYRSTFRPSRFSISIAFLVELIEKNVTGDVFAVEHASILYNICWLSLKSLCGKGTRNDGCDMSVIPVTTVVSGLKLAFILSREVPLLFQKVSRLLAVLYTFSPSSKAFSMLSSSSNVLSESQWASFFHQASLGTHLNHQLLSRIRKQEDQKTTDVDGYSLPSSTSVSLLRVAPECVLDLEEFVLKFFGGLPCTTIICISMLGDEFASLLRDLLLYNPPTHAWILLSRLNSDSVPIVILLPINSILAGSPEGNEDSSSSFLLNKKSCDKSWHCPWGHTIIDNVAPLLKTILEENYTSSAGFPLEDTKKNRSLWWSQRLKLDQLLGDFLKDVEDLWFGPWKLLLLGECSDNKHLDSVQKKLLNDLKSESKVDVDEGILKAIIGGGGHATSIQEEWLLELLLKKGCYVGGLNCHTDESNVTHPVKQDLILNTICEIGEEDFADRKPVILVLDFEIQMLPWENLPVLRNQEVYRMPSVASISSTLDRCCQYQEKVGNDSSVFPMIDPLDAYYLLNPGGDLPSTEAHFQNWLKDQNLEGTSGTSPTVDELSMALKNHDLFMYFGHGSGTQYIPGNEIQKLNGCAATFLMGCSSGSLSLNGPYTPKGAPLYYLFAGSPVIVGNLWEVTDKDIDRFGKAVLDAWIETRSSSSPDCAQCNELLDRMKNLNIDGDKRKGKKKTSRKKSAESCEVSTCTLSCKHRPKIGSFMGQARQACTLPFLIGASPVCYGVPTGIRKKDL